MNLSYLDCFATDTRKINYKIRSTSAVECIGKGKDVDAVLQNIENIHRGKIKTMPQIQRKWLKRRQAVEPAIGHLKADHRIDRNWLKGSTGDALHTF